MSKEVLKEHVDRIARRTKEKDPEFGPSYMVGYLETMLYTAYEMMPEDVKTRFLTRYRLNKF
jgi:hypothetical protein